ncbi:MAG: glycosyltransferase family 9 protein [Solirubrobacterales bacterium]|nr:glycosyltransferase family 9 protein [Solirubrobacterales bacterium]
MPRDRVLVALAADDPRSSFGTPARPRLPRLLVLRALGLGDLLTAVPALRALTRAYPDHERLLAAPSELEPLVEMIEADGQRAIHGVVDLGPLEPLPGELRGPEVAVNLHGKGPQSHRLLLATHPRRVVWFENREIAESWGAPRWRADEHEVTRWCRLLSESGVPADPGRLDLPPPPAGPELLRGATIVHPGAGSPARRWPPQRFARVARALADRGDRVIVTGAANERPLAHTVARAADLPRGSVLAGEIDLRGLAQAVAAARLVICGDTGIGHLATAFGTPSLLLFGPTPPAQWGPPPDRKQHRVLWVGRQADPHALRPDEGLLAITPAQVLRALEGLTGHDGSRKTTEAGAASGVSPVARREASATSYGR